MRRLLAPLTRWLDRRIDARIAAADAERRAVEQAKARCREQMGRVDPGHLSLVEETTQSIRAVSSLRQEA